MKRDDKDRRREDEASVNGNKLAYDMLSDLSHLNSEKAISDITGETEQQLFNRRWEKIINSGMDKEDLTFLNPMASKMLQRDDAGLNTVKRLQKELGELSYRLPRRTNEGSTVSNHLKKITVKNPILDRAGIKQQKVY